MFYTSIWIFAKNILGILIFEFKAFWWQTPCENEFTNSNDGGGNSLNSVPDSRFEEELPLLRLTCDV